MGSTGAGRLRFSIILGAVAPIDIRQFFSHLDTKCLEMNVISPSNKIPHQLQEYCHHTNNQSCREARVSPAPNNPVKETHLPVPKQTTSEPLSEDPVASTTMASDQSDMSALQAPGNHQRHGDTPGASVAAP